MSTTVNTRQVADITVVDVVGRITLGEGSSALAETVRTQLTQGNRKLLLNLGEVTYMDSAGIGELVAAYSAVSQKGGRLKLLSNKRIQELLQITRLNTLFEAYAEEEQAIQSFGT